MSILEVSEPEFERRMIPTLRLFLSADLENSTSLKQSANQSNRQWLGVILNFIKEFPEIFAGELEKRCRDRRLQDITLPGLWKVLGDELVFVTELKITSDCEHLVEAFRSSLHFWNSRVPSQEEQVLLKAKGSVWLAGFPVCNAVIYSADREDYVGPSIDLGFRLGKMATPRKMVLSADLVWFLLAYEPGKAIHFDGTLPLKGVAEETGYPCLWMEVGESSFLAKSGELLGKGFQNGSTVKELCAAFISEFGVPNYEPFITDETLNSSPIGYRNDWNDAKTFYREVVYIVDGDPNAGSSLPAQDDLKSLLDAAQNALGSPETK